MMCRAVAALELAQLQAQWVSRIDKPVLSTRVPVPRRAMLLLLLLLLRPPLLPLLLP